MNYFHQFDIKSGRRSKGLHFNIFKTVNEHNKFTLTQPDLHESLSGKSYSKKDQLYIVLVLEYEGKWRTVFSKNSQSSIVLRDTELSEKMMKDICAILERLFREQYKLDFDNYMQSFSKLPISQSLKSDTVQSQLMQQSSASFLHLQH